MNSVSFDKSQRLGRAVTEVRTILERAASYYPSDLPVSHYARRTNWRYQSRGADSPLDLGLEQVPGFEPLRRQLEMARSRAEALLVSERLGETIIGAQEREELTRRALGILPTAEADRMREIFACAELQPRRFAHSAPNTVAAFEQIERNCGRATALTYCMLSLAGQRQEEEIVRYGERLEQVFNQVVSAPAVKKALETEIPRDEPGKFETLLALLQAARDQLWLLKPNRVSNEFLLTQVIDNYLGAKSSAGSALGLALFDSIIIGKLGFRADLFMEEGALRLQVPVGNRSVPWELTDRRPLSHSTTASGCVVGSRSLFTITYSSLAAMCFAFGMFERATEAYRSALELEPGSVETRTGLAVCLLKQQLPDDAVRELRACIDLEPNAAEAHHQMGNAYALQSDWPRAIESYKRALRISRDVAEVYNNLGFAYLHSGNAQQAVAAFEAAISHRPDYYQAYFNLANLHLEQQQYDLAIKQYRETLRIEPRFVAACYNMGRAHYDKHDLDGAIHCYQKAVELNPKHSGAWYNLGIAYRDQGQAEKAVEALEKAVTINPSLMR
ncbi:tetratricopeptide repeat protein [candidate division WOR-3 bacterium]|uniref:Tetratricopeptide repeat protein n=1 Tax=candidate division WOR-3 bacterium TaxID=2052148 RepID=A0A937XGG0_UNCW3|nr:tetratricopeptide repeat protein [candidate division WOR-3 bacterium]